ncbi:MAG: hypothetical protein HKL98_07280 [Burkholderiales bacterium]|nr:hypothetical protein [Burkholderiales bacterium]
MKVEIRPSLLLAFILFLAHFSAILLVLYLSLPLLIVPFLVIGMIHSILHHALLALGDSVVSVDLGEEDCTFFTGSGEAIRAKLDGSTFVSPWLAGLNQKRRVALILPDSLGSEEFRRMRVWLRWKP